MHLTMRNSSTNSILEPAGGVDKNAPGGNHDDSLLPEPLPEWDHAQETWKWTWILHWAGFGAVFALLALYALWSVIKLAAASKKHRRKPLLALAINSLLFVFGTSRAMYLFINPYESQQCFLPTYCPVILARILFGIALPCITASFSLIHLAFLQLSKLKLYPERLQSSACLACIIAFQFGLSLFTEIMITMYANWKMLNIFCQAFFIALGLILSGSFIYSGRIILKSVRETRLSIRQLGNLSDRTRRRKVSKLVKITYITVIVGFTSCAMQLYSLIVVYNFYSAGDRGVVPEPWPWLVFQSLSRIVEIVAGCTMAYVSPKQALRHRTVKSRSSTSLRKTSTLFTIPYFDTIT